MITKEEAVRLAGEPWWSAKIRRAAWNGEWATQIDFTDRSQALDVTRTLEDRGFKVSMKAKSEWSNTFYILNISWNE